MKNIIIRKSKMSDSENLEKIFKKAIREDFVYYPAGAKKEFLNIWNAKFFRKRRPITFAAFLGDKVIGFVISNPEWQKSGVASVDWLWVDSKQRKQKVASRLLIEMEKYLKRVGHHKVALNADNKLSQQFYKKVGYVVEGEMKDHYWHLNEIRYAKVLK